MVVVQPLAHREPGQPPQVVSGVGVRLVAVGVAEGVYRRAHHQVDHRVHRGRQQAEPQPEEQAQDRDPDGQPEERVVEEDAVPRVGREVARVAGDDLLVLGDPAVEGDVAELHCGHAQQDGGVRVALDVGVRVVLAVHGHPLAGTDSGGDPREHPARGGDAGRQRQRAVGEGAMEVERGDEGGELAHHERGEQRQPEIREHARG